MDQKTVEELAAERRAVVAEARKRVDEAEAAYAVARRRLARREGREGTGRRASEPAIDQARLDVFTAQSELRRAKRALMAAVSL